MNKDELLRDALITIRHLNERLENTASTVMPNEPAIAVIGMACQFPGAGSLPVFWNQLFQRFDGVSHYPSSRLGLLGLEESHLDGDIENIYGGYLENIDLFDPELFNISPREAKCMDPQQRLLMMNVHQALQDSDIQSNSNFKNTGVFMSHYASQYLALDGQRTPENSLFMATGNAASISANRISYHYDLQGPSLVIDTACSSSLAGLDVACRYLKEGRIDYALVGAVSLNLNMDATKMLQHANMLSEDGKCKTFDERADGYVPGEGVGVVVLQRLADDLPSPGKVYSVIKGCNVNHDGKSNGLAAPNGLAQEALIRDTCHSANIEPGSLGYVETHGTGTYLGDPVEIEGLNNVVGKNRAPNTPCVLGCLKTNIGHLEPAAGIASLIKASLCVSQGMIPGNNHLNKVNPLLNLDHQSFVLPDRAVPWMGETLRAGVSSFGFGGLNGFAVLENAPNTLDTTQQIHLADYPKVEFNLESYWLDKPKFSTGYNDNYDNAPGFLTYHLIDSPTDLFRANLSIQPGQLTGIEDTGNFHIGFYIELLYKIFSDYLAKDALHIEELMFLQPLQVSQKTTTDIHLVVKLVDSNAYHVDIYFKYGTASKDWTLAAEASITSQALQTPQPIDMSLTRKLVERKLDAEDFYQRYQAMGMPGKGYVRAIETCRIYVDQTRSNLSLSFDPASYKLGAHPGFLDAVVQPAFHMLEVSDQAPYMTTTLKDLIIHKPLNEGNVYKLHNRLLSQDNISNGRFSASWAICSTEGEPFIACGEIQLQKIAEKPDTHSIQIDESSECGADTLLQFIADRLDTQPEKIKRDIPLPELGMDSLMLMRIRNMMDKLDAPVQSLFDATINDLIGKLSTIGTDNTSIGSESSHAYDQSVAQVRRILQPYSLQTNSWLGHQVTATARLRVYCFAYGHLSSSIIFKNWLGQLSPQIEVVPIELPGHGPRISERPIEHVNEMVESLANALESELHQPFVLFGHSSGALVAYALALHLQKTGRPMPQQLIVSAFTAPTCEPNPVIESAKKEYKSVGIDKLPSLSDVINPHNKELVSKIIRVYHKKTQAMGLVDLAPDLIAGQLHAIVSIMQVVDSFDPSSIVPLSIPIIAFHGEEDSQVTLEEMQAWEPLSNEGFLLRVFPGDHLFIDPSQSEKLVIEEIAELLREKEVLHG
ncbi:alpha/beta fold hydrolase [Vibrio sp. S4M6]|uniref:alpha/beta fold hydrolase n=1 Tax=Vibrio sinus TaxID=2946865 RepID=UPI00202A8423|nr:alpha/beta fold hydrolase [Vibrio sinus]MCL9781786.1 alpha/beta fold hydrolase [Vibrio sinus]